MRCNSLRWLWGLIPISMLALLAHHWERPVIEDDLAARSKQALDQLGLDWAETAFEGREAVLTGRASAEDEPRKAAEALRAVWGVRTLITRTDLVEEVATYSWRAESADRTIRLSGFVPSEQMRRSIVGMAKANFPKGRVDDRMKVARGAPKADVWLGGVGFALKQLAALKQGSVALDGASLSIAGEALDQGSYKSLRAAIPSALPKGWALGNEKIVAPATSPFVWAAKLAGSQLVLTGHVPNEAQREEVFAFAKATFPRIAVVDRTEVASGAPEGWRGAVNAGLEQLYQLREGTAEVKDKSASLSGVAEDEPTAEAVRRAFKQQVPKPIAASEAVTFLKPRLATVAVFETEISVGGDAVDVTGYAPGEDERRALIESVRNAFPGRKVNDRLALAAGANQGWQSCLKTATQALARLGAGKSTLTGGALVVTGETKDADLAALLVKSVPAEVRGVCDGKAEIEVAALPEPSLWWRAERRADGVVIEGEAPDSAQRADLVRTASNLFPGQRIDDRMKVVSRASPSWSKAAAQSLAMLGKLTRGSVALFGREIVVQGEAPEAASLEALRAILARDLPEGLTGREVVSVRSASSGVVAPRAAAEGETAPKAADDAAAQKRRAEEEALRRAASEAAERQVRQAAADRCQKLLKDTAAGGRILFEYASDKLDPKSGPTLDKLASLAAECPKARIVIEGHTSADGDPGRNQGLSERRAQSVLDYLTKAGVDAGRLSAVGYGASRPIAPNDTNINMGKNRRIEFSVVTD